MELAELKKELQASIEEVQDDRLYYRTKEDIIQIILLWDTRQNPSRNPYE